MMNSSGKYQHKMLIDKLLADKNAAGYLNKREG